MSQTKFHYIIRQHSCFVLVTVNEDSNQAQAPLDRTFAPAHTAFEGGVGDGAIKRLAGRSDVKCWRTITKLCADMDINGEQVEKSRERGRRFDWGHRSHAS